jgi:hypothetical protein
MESTKTMKDLPREYSDADIARFLKEDRISPRVAEKVRRLRGLLVKVH